MAGIGVAVADAPQALGVVLLGLMAVERDGLVGRTI
jgi:hypothetical protein